ncbi:MAG TPA: glycosyltransferase [Clostridia bacterium]|nr:glycosyltransferase [Clostridia bacterium]
MFVSIIIPAFNEERLIEETLNRVRAACEAFSHRGWRNEIIVCDNNSTDRTSELARAAGALVVFEPVNQIGRARNSGAKVASGNWLIFVDADSHPSRGLFDRVAQEIATGRVIGGGSTIDLATQSRLAKSVARFWNCLSRVFRLLAGSFIFCDATAFRELGGFNDELFAGEELDLTTRLKRLARSRDKRLVIIKDHPLVTSDRKVHLYTLREHTGFFIRAMLGGQKVLKKRENCATWYDGRR